jgi:diguanylate cyclase (GGDEF)-like protein
MTVKQILIIEINEENYTTLDKLLKKAACLCTPVLDSESFKALETNDDFDLIVVNANISYASINDIIHFAHNNRELPLPVIYIDSAKEHNKKLLEDAFKAGASEYIKKPFDSKEILARINYHSEQLDTLRNYKQRLDKLANLATIDQLSKSTSKMHMQAILKHQLNNFKRYKTETSVIYLSLLNIDKLVGTFGLEKGEQVIAQFSKVLKESIRKSDVLGRWAGSEFIILLTNTSLSASEYLAKKLKTKLSAIEIMKGIKPDLAMGVTTFLDEDDEVQEIIERAKYALKEAKKQTYGKVQIA